MSSSEYILTEELEAVATAVKIALGLGVLNYQYGYVEELIETLGQMEADRAKFEDKYPLIWVAEPYEVRRDDASIGGVATVDIFIINQTEKTWKAKDRMENNFIPVIYPIYRELMKQIRMSVAFDHPFKNPTHTTVNRYYWGENSRSVLNDVVDAMKISGAKLRICLKPDCKPFSNM